MVAPVKASDMPLGKGVERYLQRVFTNAAVESGSYKTHATYQQNLGFMLTVLDASMMVDDVSGEDVDKVLVAYAMSGDRRKKEAAQGAGKGKSLASQSIFRASLSAFFSDAVHRGWCQVSPMEYASVKTPKPSRVRRNPAREGLTAEQAQALLDVGAGSLENARTDRAVYRYHVDRAIVASLAFLGLRNSELCALDWDDFVLRPGGRFVNVRGKGGRERAVPVGEGLWGLLTLLRERHDKAIADSVFPLVPGAENAVFVSSRGQRVSPLYVRRALGKAVERVQADETVAHLARHVVPHGLRHTAASLWLAGGEASLPMVRDLLGHANVSTTSVYLGSDEGALMAVAGSSGLSINNN